MSLLLLLRGAAPVSAGEVTADVLEEAGALDTLIRTPRAELRGRKWHGIWAGTGDGTPTGWTHSEGEEFSTARWWSNGFPGPAFVGVTFAVSLSVGQEFKFMLLDDKVGNCIELKFAYNTAEQYFWALIEEDDEETETVLDSGFVPRVTGDRFYLSAEEGTNGIQAWRQAVGGGPESIGQGTLAIPFTALGKTADIKLYKPGAFRATNFAAGSLNPDPPIAEKPAGPTLISLNYSNWGPAEDAELAQAVSITRFDAELGVEALEAVLAVGLKVHMLFPGPYDEGGVLALDPDEWVADALAFYEANVTPETAPIVEVLNEPGGWWFWGEDCNSPANSIAYRILVQKTYEAFHAKYGSEAPKIIASVEGNGLQFGEQWWLPECAAFCDGVVVHPYGGTGEKAESALGNRARVEEARELTGMPVYITEVGWPTALEAAPTGDSLQWTEEEQAANLKAFLRWARGAGYIAEVVVYTFHDFGTQTWYGVVRLDGSHKAAYAVIEDAAFPPQRIAVVTQEYPPDKLAWRVDPPQGAPSRWAADEPLAENVCEDIQLTDDMPGGDKEGTCVLARNPRTPWPDLAPYSNCSVYGPGVEEVGCYRLDKAPESDGDRMVTSPAAVGWRNALEDDKAIIGPGFIDGDLSKWRDPSTSRRSLLESLDYTLQVATSAGYQGTGDVPPGIVFTFGSKVEGKKPIGEQWFDGGGVTIGALRGDFRSMGGAEANATFDDYMFLSPDDVGSVQDLSADFDQATTADQMVVAAGSNRKFAGVSAQFNTKAGAFDFTNNTHGFLNLRVLGDHGLVPHGAFPNIGFTASQMLGYAVPKYTVLTADPDDLEDSNYLIQQAWFSDPGPISQVVQELTKYELLDWFVFGGKRFQMRFPGTYGRRWQAYSGPSGLQEQGLDASRLWQRIVVSFQDVDGSTRTVGPPGSGAMVEDPGLEITDPDHPAVRAAEAYGPRFNRKELLALKGISEAPRAIEAGERWLREANLLSRSGSCTLSGYVMDDRGIFRPVSQVRAGDLIRFPDAGDTSYRKVVQRNYAHSNRTASLALDAPAEGIAALLERMQADIQRIGI